jgi:ethanolamine utilization protein EutP (predicted NTPase)
VCNSRTQSVRGKKHTLTPISVRNKTNKQKTQKEKEKRRYRIKCTGLVLEEHSSDTLIIKLLECQMISKIFGANKQKGIMPEGGEP